MNNEEKTEKTSEELELTPGEKFIREYLEMPYTNDRVGQVFVVLRPGFRIALNTKSDVAGENPDHCKDEKEQQ